MGWGVGWEEGRREMRQETVECVAVSVVSCCRYKYCTSTVTANVTQRHPTGLIAQTPSASLCVHYHCIISERQSPAPC